MSVRLNRAATSLLQKFFRTRPDIFRREILEHGVNPIQVPDKYMQAELDEPAHKHSSVEIWKNRGVIDVTLLAHWIKEELEEDSF